MVCVYIHSHADFNVESAFCKEEIPKKVWVYDTGGGRKSFEFHGPDKEYEYNLDADCKWSALSNGWGKLLDRREDSHD